VTPTTSTPPRATTPLSILVITQFPENVDAISALLQSAGQSVYCTWLSDGNPLGEILTRTRAELIVLFQADGLVDLADLKTLRGNQQPRVPIILVADQADETAMTEALNQGAQDLGSLAQATRLRRICEREIRTFRRDRALMLTVGSARKHQDALAAFMAASADAIVHLRDTEILDGNRAWNALVGLADDASIASRSILDFLAPQSHAALKGALTACRRGQWANHPLKLTATNSLGRTLSLEVELDSTEWQGVPAIRLRVPAAHTTDPEGEPSLVEELRLEPATGLLHRHSFLDALRERLAEPLQGGVRYLIALSPDDLAAIQKTVGPLRVENFMTEFAALVRAALLPHDLAGRFSSDTLMLLIERGNTADAELWINNLLGSVHGQIFKVEEHTLATTASAGLAIASASADAPADQWAALVVAAVGTLTNVQKHGGRKLAIASATARQGAESPSDNPADVARLREAIDRGRFRLIAQPIASLGGDAGSRSDLVIRLIDAEGHDVLPSEFLPIAERHGLLPAIDHWVVEAALEYLRKQSDESVFIRVSEASVRDAKFLPFVTTAVKLSGILPGRLCLQINQQTAEAYLPQTHALRLALAGVGCRFALDRFGASGELEPLVATLTPDVLKIDGALVQGLANQQQQQQRIKAIIKLADAAEIDTIAERVEDASTMAVLFQLGVKAIQGYFVRAPETVTMGD